MSQEDVSFQVNRKLLALTASMAALLTWSAFWFQGQGQQPTDLTLLTRFRESRPVLQTFVDLNSKQPVLTGDGHESSNATLQSCGINFVNRAPGKIFFEVWGTGCTPCTDLTEGYAYCEQEPRNLERSLEVAADKVDDDHHVILYRKIKDHWYLYFELLP